MDAQAGLLLEHGGDPRKGPEIIGEAMGLRPLREESAQGLAVGFLDLGWLSQRTTLPGRLTLGLKRTTPPQRGRSGDFALPGHLRLGNSPRQQRHSLPSARLHGLEVALGRPRLPNP